MDLEHNQRPVENGGFDALLELLEDGLTSGISDRPWDRFIRELTFLYFEKEECLVANPAIASGRD